MYFIYCLLFLAFICLLCYTFCVNKSHIWGQAECSTINILPLPSTSMVLVHWDFLVAWARYTKIRWMWGYKTISLVKWNQSLSKLTSICKLSLYSHQSCWCLSHPYLTSGCKSEMKNTVDYQFSQRFFFSFFYCDSIWSSYDLFSVPDQESLLFHRYNISELLTLNF